MEFVEKEKLVGFAVVEYNENQRSKVKLWRSIVEYGKMDKLSGVGGEDEKMVSFAVVALLWRRIRTSGIELCSMGV